MSSDCIFMYGRGFRPLDKAEQYIAVDLPYTHHPVDSFKVEFKFWRSWRKITRFDNYVKKLTDGQRYYLYTNQTGMNFIRLFISNRKCCGFSLLEEGLYSYYPIEQINMIHSQGSNNASFVYKILLYLNFRGRLHYKNYFFSSNYKAVYGVTEAAFPDFRNKVTVPFSLNKFSNSKVPDNSTILALDALPDYGVVGWEYFASAVKKVFDYFNETGVQEVWIKYHPEQYAVINHLNRIKDIISKAKQSIEVRNIVQEQSLELLAADKNISNLTFYVFLSSVGLYAALCGRKVFSFAHYITDQSPAYRSRAELLPEIYKNNVIFLEDRD